MSQTIAANAVLTDEAKLLIHIAATVPVLCRLMGIVKKAGDVPGKEVVGLLTMPRSWIVPHPVRGAAEMSFDPDKFARVLKVCSDGERHCILWLLNVWNPAYAKAQGWNFDMLEAMGTLDEESRFGIANWMVKPRWP